MRRSRLGVTAPVLSGSLHRPLHNNLLRGRSPTCHWARATQHAFPAANTLFSLLRRHPHVSFSTGLEPLSQPPQTSVFQLCSEVVTRLSGMHLRRRTGL